MLALDHFLRGLDLLNHFNKEDTERGRVELQKAADLDPNYAKPLAKISWSDMMDAYLGWSANPTKILGRGAGICEEGRRAGRRRGVGTLRARRILHVQEAARPSDFRILESAGPQSQ